MVHEPAARAFRQRLVRVPLSLDNPYWIEDPDFDLEFHVRHIALPKPGDWGQLCIQAARLHARPLDMRKPPWEAYVIQGLDNVAGVPKDGFALVTKIHHAAIDGVSGAEIAAAIHDLSPDAEVEEPSRQWMPERIPTGVELLTNSAVRSLAGPVKFSRLLMRSAPSLAKVIGGTSLVAMVPMSIRPEDKQRSAGNMITAMSLPMRTDIADPLKRLLAVSAESNQAKKLCHC